MKKIEIEKLEKLNAGAIPTHTKCFIAALTLFSGWAPISAHYLYNNCG